MDNEEAIIKQTKNLTIWKKSIGKGFSNVTYSIYDWYHFLGHYPGDLCH